MIFSYLLITLCYLGLAIVNYPFADDNYRLPNNNDGWLGDGRYLMHYLYQILTSNINKSIVIATPYTYFLSTAFLALTSLILAHYFNRKNIYISLIISCFFCITPFYWGNIIYLLDRLGMAFSLFYAIAIALFSYHLKPKSAFIFQSITVFALFFLYQPMLLSTILLLAFLCCYNLIENKLSLKTIYCKALISGSSLALATIIFWILNKLVLNHFKHGYGVSAVGISNKIGQGYMIERLKAIFSYLVSNWQNSSFGYLMVIILLLFVSLLIYRFKQTKPSLVAIGLFILALITIFISPTLILILSPHQILTRFCFGFGPLLSLALLYFYNHIKHQALHKLAIAITILLLLNCLAMASYLGNRVEQQSKHDREIATLLKDDVYQLTKSHTMLKIVSLNSINSVKTFDIPHKPIYLPATYSLLKDSGWWLEAFKIDGKGDESIKPLLANLQGEKIEVIDRRYYRIFYYPSLNLAEIDFKDKEVSY